MMVCVTCGAEPVRVAKSTDWCPQCGTLQRYTSTKTPQLVLRCRQFEHDVQADVAFDGAWRVSWLALGIDRMLYTAKALTARTKKRLEILQEYKS